MKDTLEFLFNGGVLTRKEAADHLKLLAEGTVSLEQMTAFTTVFRMRPIEVKGLQGFRDTLLALKVPVNIENNEAIDIVGTGGDGKNTFNISTTSAFVIAGAGFRVCKHGSYGVSSNCGSSNVLMELGYEFTKNSDRLNMQLDKAKICFFHAPLFHPAMKAVVPMRKGLKIKTFFNMLGPLVNPLQPEYQLFGTYNLEVANLYNELLKSEGKKYTVVYADDGYDEISLTSSASVFRPDATISLNANDFGLPVTVASELFGGESPKEAGKILTNVLNNKGTVGQTSAVLANAALAIQTIDSKLSLNAAVSKAKESIESGKAMNALKKLIENN